MMITPIERLQACIRGEATDRTPVALWRHFPVDDQTPESLANATLNFQKVYNFDLVKVTPASSFCLKDWGVEDTWVGNTEGTRRYTERVIVDPGDWERLPILEPSARFLADQLRCLQLIRKGLGQDVPMLQTIFNPLAQAKNLAGGERLLVHIRKYPEAVHKGLDTIAATTKLFIDAARQVGVDGIFYAVQHAQASLLNQDEYLKFGLAYDQKALVSANDMWCNILHVHGQDIYFSLLSALDFPIMNWHDRDTGPSLTEAQKTFQGVLCGGLAQETLVYRDSEAVLNEAGEAFTTTGRKRFILSTGCVVPIIAPHGNIQAARRSVE
jgi:uroporphyrinogen decarboxylase